MRFSRFLLLLPAGCSPAAATCPSPSAAGRGRRRTRLAVPLAIRLVVPPPSEALLTDAGAQELSERVAAALQAEEVPAIALPRPLPLDWQVEILAERRGEAVLPRFRLLDADGKLQAATEGQPVPIGDLGRGLHARCSTPSPPRRCRA